MVQYVFSRLFKATRNIIAKVNNYFSTHLCRIIFYGQNVRFKSFTTIGIPFVSVAIGGSFKIGKNLKMNNTLAGNPIGRPQRCTFFVDKGAQLTIGNNVGISQSAIVCHSSITIGNNVKIGGGTCIYDTDFHSLDPEIRQNPVLDKKYKVNKSVTIKDNAFIGAHTTVLKGVTIGENSVIGACSLVIKDIPDNEIWAGNPARFIKSVETKKSNHLSIH